MTDDAWVSVAGAGTVRASDQPLRWGRLVGGVVVLALLVFAGVAAVSAVTARRAAEREAVNDALAITDVLGESVMQPALTDDLSSADATRRQAALDQLDVTVRERLLSDTIVRVKLWKPDGTIVYADESQLIGMRFALDDEEIEALDERVTKAEISDLSAPENRFERSNNRKLLEVYRPVWAPDGQTLLFETYSAYDAVTARTSQLWRGFGGITLTSLLLLLVAQAPLTWALVARVRRAQAEREAYLARAVQASDDERRRIAATLHDGAVQELVGSAFLVAGVADRARAAGDGTAAQQLDLAAGSVRSSIGGLRSLLVDIYPPSLRSAGLRAALTDLAAPLRAQGVGVLVEVPDEPELTAEKEELVFRVAQECLRNIMKHADAENVRVGLHGPDEEGHTVLELVDDGVGFDLGAVLARPEEGHFGLRLVADQAAAAGAELRVRTAPGEGTSWRLEVPR
ncbi:integral membrane sensor signal transduction histidine kinase [Kineosporia sp. J2-2]|uniref:Integral membrane sensor signal transduction histidine kinase n=1 Tax=Kineosporia corallincola TaxID=2835133 RepID=A0ABS5TNZ7_9ACTN|nr:histidine kinase [Kineosporia corallincola]MBT0772720.1 integral membrane sensor signal transduction histidine kinase [Kineosporia corallincola]